MGVTCGKLVVMMAGVDAGVMLKELVVEGLDIVVEMLSAIAVVVIVVVMAISTVSTVVDVALSGSDINNGVLMGTFELTVVTSIISEGIDIVVEMLSAIAVVAIVVVMATSRVSNVVDASTGGSVDNGVLMGGKFELTIVTSLVPTFDEMKLS